MKRAPVLLSLIVTYLVFGASAVEANDPRAMQLTYEPWTKICFSGSNCLVAAGARGTCYPSGGALSINIPNDKTVNLSANLGTKRGLEGAISIRIDHDDPILIAVPQCYAPGCSGKVEIDGKFIERLKRSRTITIEATNTAHQKIGLSLSLADFAKAYDGPASDPPKVYEETSEKMKELLRQQAEKNPPCED
jgi:invasion protein IalB